MALQVAAISRDARRALEICRRAVELADYRLKKFPSIQESASAARDFLHKNMESDKRLESNGNEEVEYKALPGGPSNGTHKETNTNGDQEVPILENVYWKEFGLLVFVWAAFLALQTAKKTLLLFDTEQDNNLFDCLLDFELNAVGVVGSLVLVVDSYWVLYIPNLAFLPVSSVTTTFAMAFSSSIGLCHGYYLWHLPRLMPWSSAVVVATAIPTVIIYGTCDGVCHGHSQWQVPMA
ncbi:hypothetical protein IFM89_025556 [Coptis chinensis]|uniref:AAA lid domain-containing protein n=1 Tax=Coptis chinensis TaxID=261450 RepID=A0A835HGZ9_9MAGN|nr:hypothetical protein IFM89_025556 [Coptis chinensis]